MGGEAAHGSANLGMRTDVVLPSHLDLNEREMCDLEMLLMGSFAPLEGYMTAAEYNSCLDKMRLPSGAVWPIPIILSVPKTMTSEGVTGASGAQKVVLRDTLGVAVAEVSVSDIYEPDLPREMEKVLGSTDLNHPYAAYMTNTFTNSYYLGGPIRQLAPISRFDFLELRRTAKEVREDIQKRGWKAVVGFQTRNPMHRSHYELTKHALREVEKTTGEEAHLLLTPAVGPTQPGDVEYHIRVRCYKKLLKRYEESGAAAELILLPLAMRMAGPREAVWHSIIRRNYGCTHFIVGRDHAGPSAKKTDGSAFYGPYEAHELLTTVAGDLGITPVFGKMMVYVGEEHGGYLEADKIPEGVEAQNISGTQQREMLQTREHIPEWFSYPDVVEELHKFYLPSHEKGVCIAIEGQPLSGKSSLATALEAALLAGDTEVRRVSIVDGSTIPADIQPFICGELVKHGAICLLASGLAVEEQRGKLKRAINESGGALLEVALNCSDAVIKERTQLTKKMVTSMIYDAPKSPDLTLDSSKPLVAEVDQIVATLRERNLVR